MQRAAACIGILALAVALGALVVGQLVVLPGLEGQNALVDANLLTRLVMPVHLRCMELALVGSVLLLGVAPYWLRSRLITTLALVAVTGTGALRMIMLPAVYEAWSRVDRVALALNTGSHHMNVFRVNTIVDLDPTPDERLRVYTDGACSGNPGPGGGPQFAKKWIG